METFDGRLRSFSKPKTKSSSKSSTARTWPHPDTFVATPTSLAEAGFFFKPSKAHPDNVQCFICKKEIDGWDEDDNPFDIHVKKSPECAWAIARCSLEFDVDSDGKFLITDSSRLPTNKVLEKARADTFGGKKWWPHNSVKAHGATSKKMAKAGFVYTPQAQGDDTATCFYCNLSLSGWDAEDDPTEEHIKRVEKSGKPCPFFQATERPKSQASTRSTKSISRKSRAPKHAEVASDEDDEPITIKAPSKKGKQKHNEPKKLSKPPSKHSDAEETDDLEEDDDPSLKVQPAPAPRKSTRKPAAKSKPISKSTAKSKQRLPTPEETDEVGSEVDSRRARSRSKSGKGNSKEEQKEKTKEKESEKPPSNVDGKIAKSYHDFTLDINAAEEAKERGRKKGGLKGRSTSRGRSRSKSKPRSTASSSLVDPQVKPLLRASTRSRVSGITEIEEMETEKMLAEPPSEMETERDLIEPPPEMETERMLAEPPPETDHETKPTPQRLADTRDMSPMRSPEPSLAPISRPTTPENQIIRQRPSGGPPASTDFHSSLHIPPSPADLFLPPLANSPVQVVAALTDEERAMTVEQWIRHEMAVQYRRLKEDGEMRIRAFLEKAEETRRQIEAV